MKYKIELTEEQMRVTEKCLEEYFRLRLNQPQDFANDMADIAYPKAMIDEPGHEMQFEKMILLRDNIENVMEAIFKMMAHGMNRLTKKTDDMEIAECIWDAIRFARGRSRWGQPFQIGPEPTPNIEEIEEPKKGKKK